MFVKDTTIEVNWLIPASSQVYAYTDFDVIVKKPDGSSQYLDGVDDNPILPEDFIAPTVDTIGGISYRLTPDTKGVWVVILTIGDSADSDIYYEYYLRVSEPDTHIYQQVNLG